MPDNLIDLDTIEPTVPAKNALQRSMIRAVLDSNIWVDILIFDEPQTRPIRQALESGTLHVSINAPCLDELTRVLDYRQFQRYGIDRENALGRVAKWAELYQGTVPSAGPALPKCSDRDDQKFLELTQAVSANWLVTKDRALLKLARRVARDFGFNVGVPELFLTALNAARSNRD
jgi:putative PIN family toxin of toxin-antitoxin system